MKGAQQLSFSMGFGWDFVCPSLYNLFLKFDRYFPKAFRNLLENVKGNKTHNGSEKHHISLPFNSPSGLIFAPKIPRSITYTHVAVNVAVINCVCYAHQYRYISLNSYFVLLFGLVVVC